MTKKDKVFAVKAKPIDWVKIQLNWFGRWGVFTFQIYEQWRNGHEEEEKHPFVVDVFCGSRLSNRYNEDLVDAHCLERLMRFDTAEDAKRAAQDWVDHYIAKRAEPGDYGCDPAENKSEGRKWID